MIIFALGSVNAEENIGTTAKELGVSKYKHFVIYPHLDRALKAQRENNKSIALREFEHAHSLAPNSIPLTIYLIEAYRYFKEDDQARSLIQEKLKQYPDNARLQKQLSALPANIEIITTLAELQNQQQYCDAEPTVTCKVAVGQNALRLKALDIARQQLVDLENLDKQKATEIERQIIQRAIHLQEWYVVDAMFSEINNSKKREISIDEKRQWFNALILGRLDTRLLSLQSKGLFNSTVDKITYAGELLERKEYTQLEKYLDNVKLNFKTANQEKSWLYLLSNYHADPYQKLIKYDVVFPENLEFVIDQVLPDTLINKNYDLAKVILNKQPKNRYLEERYAVSVAMQDSQESIRVARELYRKNSSNLNYLNQLSWLLVESGKTEEAIRYLISHYPFAGDKELAPLLMMRMSDILSNSPSLVTVEQNKMLLKPLPTVEQRQLQSSLSWFINNCPATEALLSDLSSEYSAATWRLLAECYRIKLPGLALYAYQQAELREPTGYSHRAVAYQAYQVKDYKEALRAWKNIETVAMDHKDLQSAAQTAHEAQDIAARDLWLIEQKRRGLDNTEHYWWLNAQRYLPSQPELALIDLNRAIAVKPTVRGYTSRSAIYRQQGKLDKAIQDVHESILLEPDNKELQATLGYLLWEKGDFKLSREAHELALTAMPDDEALLKQLAYASERLNDIPRTQHYARQVIDNLYHASLVEELSLKQNQELFDFRRLHESIARRLSFNFDLSIGLKSESAGFAGVNPETTSDKKNRSYRQLELDYRLGRDLIIDGDSLSLYSRVAADTGKSGKVFPTKNSMLGLGVRWKPLRDSVFFVSLEELRPFKKRATTMLRLSASLLNNGRFSDEWHPNGKGWLAHNLYLDAAQLIRDDEQLWTADYRVSWHQKIKEGQTIEPYAHLQVNGNRANFSTTGNQLAGIGARWNIWLGGSLYDAWPHKISLGLEYQRNLKAINSERGKRDSTFFTLGFSW